MQASPSTAHLFIVAPLLEAEVWKPLLDASSIKERITDLLEGTTFSL